MSMSKHYLPVLAILAGYLMLSLASGWRVVIAVMTIHLGDYLLSYDREYLMGVRS